MLMLEVEVAGLYVENIAVFLLDAAFGSLAGCTAALSHSEVILLCGKRFIFAGCRVEVGKFSARNFIFAHKLRNERVVDCHCAAHGVTRGLCVNVVLRVVHIELRREADCGRLEIFDVTRASDYVAVSGSLVGLEHLRLYFSRNCEIAHSPIERCRLRFGQRQNINR